MSPSPFPSDHGTARPSDGGPARPSAPGFGRPAGRLVRRPVAAEAARDAAARDARVPVAVVTAVDPVLRGALVANLMLDLPGTLELRYELSADGAGLRRLVVGRDGTVEDVLVQLEHPCVSCAMREDAIPTLDRFAGRPEVRAILLSPPISADPRVVVGALVAHQESWRLARSIAVASASRAVEDLLGQDTLAERDLRWAADDDRSVGEALAAQIEYSELIVLAGADGSGGAGSAAGLELVEHLRADDQLLATCLHDLDARVAIEGRTDHGAGVRRRDPLSVRPHGGPTAHGTWTLDLCSDRPFHPRRLLENVEALGAGRLRGRGRFRVADRPAAVCQWDGAGGQASIAVVAEAAREQPAPATRLVVTGVDAADAMRVRDAFARCLLTDAERSAGSEAWLGAQDVLAPWLGARTVTPMRPSGRSV